MTTETPTFRWDATTRAGRTIIFRNFLQSNNGKCGRCADSVGDCIYFDGDGNGCAIGCQPGFAERIVPLLEYAKATGFSVAGLGCDGCVPSGVYPPEQLRALGFLKTEFRMFFNIPSEDECAKDPVKRDIALDALRFLSSMQRMHDDGENWTFGNKLEPEAILQFIRRWDLDLEMLKECL